MTGILLSIGGSNIKSNLSGTTATDGVKSQEVEEVTAADCNIKSAFTLKLPTEPDQSGFSVKFPSVKLSFSCPLHKKDTKRHKMSNELFIRL